MLHKFMSIHILIHIGLLSHCEAFTLLHLKMCMWKFSSHRRFDHTLNQEEVIEEEWQSDVDVPYISDDVETTENIIVEMPNSLNCGIELDLDDDVGILLDPCEEDWDVDAELQELSKKLHTYCNIEVCKVHGSYFKVEVIR